MLFRQQALTCARRSWFVMVLKGKPLYLWEQRLLWTFFIFVHSGGKSSQGVKQGVCCLISAKISRIFLPVFFTCNLLQWLSWCEAGFLVNYDPRKRNLAQRKHRNIFESLHPYIISHMHEEITVHSVSIRSLLTAIICKMYVTRRIWAGIPVMCTTKQSLPNHHLWAEDDCTCCNILQRWKQCIISAVPVPDLTLYSKN